MNTTTTAGGGDFLLGGDLRANGDAPIDANAGVVDHFVRDCDRALLVGAHRRRNTAVLTM